MKLYKLLRCLVSQSVGDLVGRSVGRQKTSVFFFFLFFLCIQKNEDERERCIQQMVSEFLSDVETDYDSMIGEESGWCFSQILKGNTVKTRNNEFEKNKHSCTYCQKKICYCQCRK